MKPYTCKWFNEEKKIILFDIIAPWNWEDAFQAIQEQLELADSVDHGVHAIYHFHNVPTIPRGSGFTNLKRLASMQHPNDRLACFVGTHGLLQAIMNILSSVYGLRDVIQTYHFVETPEEAFKIIADYEREHPEDAAL